MNLTDIMLISIVILTIYLLFGKAIYEKFQRMNYIQLHDYLDRLYNYAPKYPYRLYHPPTLQQPTVSLTGRLGYQDDGLYNLSTRRYTYANQDRLIGYLSSEDLTNNDIYHLYEVYDYRRGRPGYAYKDSKSPSNRDSVLINIDPKSYDGDYLYDGDTINITYANTPFKVHLYTIKRTGLTTRYPTQDYRSGMYEYALLQPVNAPADIEEEDRYYILYEQEIDPRRDQNNYYIKDKRGVIIEVDTNTRKLYDGDTLLIPGKERYGEYRVTELDKY